ncbi:hypothetical protein DFH09DRAFT_1373701 [Mycena vulgaris]|nr:hypothetical protein DFH09DRAFT_1373701 [Mycena vulgaris]
MGGLGIGHWGMAMGVTMGMGVAAAQALIEAACSAVEQARARAQRAEDDAYGYAFGSGAHPSYPSYIPSYNQHTYGRTPGTLNPLALGMGLGMANVAGGGVALAKGKEANKNAKTSGISCCCTLPGVFRPEDNVVKGAVSAFVELGEGSVPHVLVIAGERGWLKAQTRWTDMLRLAMAAKRWGAGEATTRGGHDYSQTVLATRGKERSLRADRDRQRSRARSASLESIDPYRPLTKEEEDQRYANNAVNAAARGYDEEDEEVTVALEMTVKEMALGGIGRGGGFRTGRGWRPPISIMGAKKRRNGSTGGASCVVVDLTAVVAPSLRPGLFSCSPHQHRGFCTTRTPRHPGPPTPPLPTYVLAEAAHHAYMKTMRLILLPALNNVVRRIVIDCALDAADPDADVPGGLSAARKPLDPAMRAARMSLADEEEEGPGA